MAPTAPERAQANRRLNAELGLPEPEDENDVQHLVNQQIRRLHRRRVYGPPIFDSLVDNHIPMIALPDSTVHPAPGTPIGPFPHHRLRITYPSKMSAFNHLLPIALSLGYSLAIYRSREDANNGKRWYQFTCVHGPTRRTGDNEDDYEGEEECPFYISICNNGPNNWFTTRVYAGQHTHAALDPYGTPAMLRVYLAMNEGWIKNMIEADREPKEIMARLYESNVPYKAQSIYQYRTAYLKELNAGLGDLPTQYTLEQLENKPEDISVPWINHLGHLEGFLFSTATARALSHRFSAVFMVDVTFRTNKYNLPCLHIVGKTNMNTTFTSAVILLPNRNETTYVEALRAWKTFIMLDTLPGLFLTDREPGLTNALLTVYPTILVHYCTWHICKNIEEALARQKLKPELQDEVVGAWQREILYNNDINDLNAAHDRLRLKFGNLPVFGLRTVLNYIRNDLGPIENRYVAAHINLVFHLGHDTTSPAEGTHATLKRWFDGKKPNSSTFVRLSRRCMDRQYQKWHEGMASAAAKPTRGRDPVLRPFLRTISSYALNHVADALDRLEKGEDGVYVATGACTGYRERVWRLPCRHKLAARLNEGTWAFYEFDSYWHITPKHEMDAMMARAALRDPMLAGDARTQLQLQQEHLPPVVQEPIIRPAGRTAYRNEQAARQFNGQHPENTRRDRTGPEIAEIERAREAGDDAFVEGLMAAARESDVAAAVRASQPTTLGKQRRCRYCTELGHNIRGCAKRKEEEGRAPSSATVANPIDLTGES